MQMHRVMNISFSFTIGEGKMSELRARTAFQAAIQAVAAAVTDALPEGMVEDLTTSISYGYPQFHASDELTAEEVNSIGAVDGAAVLDTV